jgi:hypothetical protein
MRQHGCRQNLLEGRLHGTCASQRGSDTPGKFSGLPDHHTERPPSDAADAVREIFTQFVKRCMEINEA